MRKYQETLLVLPVVLILASCVSNQAASVSISSPTTTVSIPASTTTLPPLPTSTTLPLCENPNPPGHLCIKAPTTPQGGIAVPVPTNNATTTTMSYVDKMGAAAEVIQIIIDENSASNPSPAETAYFAGFNRDCGQDTASSACISWLENNPPPLGGFPATTTTTTIHFSSPLCIAHPALPECPRR